MKWVHKEKFEDINGVTQKPYIQGQTMEWTKDKDKKRTNNDLQNNTKKTQC